MLVTKERGNLRRNEPSLRFLVSASYNDRPTAFPNAELRASVRGCYAGLDHIGFPLTHDEWESSLQNLSRISVILSEYDASPSDVYSQALQRIASCEYSLSGVAHQKEPVGRIAHQGMKKLDAEIERLRLRSRAALDQLRIR